MKDSSILNQFQGFLDTPDIFPKDHQGNFKSFNFPKIKITDDLIVDLQKLDHPRYSILGKRMEGFFEIAIRHSDRYEIIDSNIQIIENKQTLGELDFIIYDKENSKPIHVELVYKLYIYDPGFPPGIKRWIGPNRRDSFSAKLEKLENKQLPLLFSPKTTSYLSTLELTAGSMEQQLCFKAQLYTPIDEIVEHRSLINSDCLIGNWYNFDEFLQMNWEDHLFYSPKKKDWSFNPVNNTNWYSRKELLKNIEVLFEKKKAPLIWMKTKTGFYRFFIVWW
ncbi:DUF1853 family protein [Christiangramia sediminis]|uniref:DUF1853 family protein n=1 Tax=Christiangramia sediminis TaxID=2881336 RepID=A0A9X1LHD6_9FLAO|nr:DUF1853 family protein [Christiangramia sediminis]MCB7480355.1 DUF1853 family protein [Christiangramia sediminis]